MVRLIKTVREMFFKTRGADSFDIFESEIDGEFHGWSGNTRFALVNGQVWQQSSTGHARHHAHSPRVMIYRSGPAIKMHVDGIDHTICVERIK